MLRPSEGTLEVTHGLLSIRGNGEASYTTPIPAAEAEALSEDMAAARIGDREQTEDAAAVRTRGERLAKQRPLL